jgi:hypothetical protein
MNKQIILPLLLCLAMFGLARGGPGGEAPQTALLSGEQLKWQVVTASGGRATGGGFALTSSLGQTAVRQSTSTSFHLIHGFLQNFGTAVAPCTSCGDANNDGGSDISDVVFVIAYIFSGGAAPGECNNPTGLGDADGSGSVDISDVVFLIAYIFSGGLAPHCP